MPNVTLKEHLGLAAGEREVLRLVAQAFEDDEIAEATGLKVEVIGRRMSAFLARIDAEDRFATAWAIQHRSCCIAPSA